MDPLLDYYLCTRDGEAELWTAFGEDVDTLPGYDSVRKIPFWQALQWDVALSELERSSAWVPELFPLSAFMGASEDRIRELLGDGDPG